MKTLENIQTLFKIGKIFSKIIFIFSLIGVVGSVVGMVCLPFGDTGVFKIGGVTVYSLIKNQESMELNSLYAQLSGILIICIGQAVVAKFAERYFAHELAEGTPFTMFGAQRLFRLGLVTVCVPLGTIVLAQIVSSIVAEFAGCENGFEPDGGSSVILGAMFMIMSFLCRYGAELREKNETSLKE